MSKVYAVVGAGWEYNDSTYDVGGKITVERKAFNNKTDAINTVKAVTEETLEKFRFCDFDSEYCGREYYRLRDLWFEATGYTWRDYHVGWGEFIEFCKSNKYDWFAAAPRLYQVVEIEVD